MRRAAAALPIELPADAPPTECAAHGRGACEAACERGDGTACLAASIGYATSPGADFPKMRELEQRACSLGIALGCFHYASNFTGGARQDLALADEYDAKACDAGLVKGCMRRAARALEATNDGIADPKLAMAMLNRVCELQPGIVCAMA